jgi:hypothetical protein
MKCLRYCVLVGLCSAFGCGGAAPPVAGDVVTPVLSSRAAWVAGKSNPFQVRLRATSGDGSNERLLDFDGIPTNANPSATVTFYQGDSALPPLAVALDHRC